jgi:hypothetical protein
LRFRKPVAVDVDQVNTGTLVQKGARRGPANVTRATSNEHAAIFEQFHVALETR